MPGKITGWLLAFIFFFHPASSQVKDHLVNHPDKYRIRLPEELMKPKIIRAVGEILPQTIDELKGMDFCTDGKAAYYVFLRIDSLTEIKNNLSFHAALRIYDSTGKPIADLRLISTEEKFDARQPASKPSTSNNYSTTEYIYSAAPDEYGNYQRVPAKETLPPVWNDDFITYSRIDLNILDLCKNKILEIRKQLKAL